MGKTTLAARLKKETGCKLLSLSDVIEKKQLYRRRCDTFDTWEYSPGRVKKYLQQKMKNEQGYILDTHDPESVDCIRFDLIIVLTCHLSVLSERYRERGYSQVKAEENLQAEIMEVAYSDVIEYLCETEAEIGGIVQICTTEDKEPKDINKLFNELSAYPKWKNIFGGPGQPSGK